MAKKFVSGTGEWASHSVNVQSGCEHNCIYCYARANAARYKKHDPTKWDKVIPNRAAVSKTYGKKTGTIMFPTEHDITPLNLSESITVLTKMLKAGNKVLVVSKPHFYCVVDMCRELEAFKGQILFRFTIGSADDAVLKKWEPGATTFGERVECLKHAHAAGFQTSVSCEPMLDQQVDKVVEAVRPFVTDAVWLGKPNKITTRIVMNNPDLPDAAVMANDLEMLFPDVFVWHLYNLYKDDPMVKWKDSIKAVVGLERHTEKGLDK